MVSGDLQTNPSSKQSNNTPSFVKLGDKFHGSS